MSRATLQRTAFETSWLLEFFSKKELTLQIGHEWQLCLLALIKELIDNALDACECAGVAPVVTIIVEATAVSVADNGPRLPARIIERFLDYDVLGFDRRLLQALKDQCPLQGLAQNTEECLGCGFRDRGIKAGGTLRATTYCCLFPF